ncbi:MAG: type II toxin-antitoxin system prevent-host-death family antitoxin [Pseudomonadota bacterium]|uniref:Antitoxin n=1 Tax=Candidatus Desulfatibia profunda TaxID=2841695 RepID=A0A8J6NSK8_9BACT|nr:type II toxin-antitoxin system Phd/YefM family antitoxin [Candidatus Desulfatibia profunda]MBL7179190.1 type II toxin-antitoxin system Phd/YefM family antitoxin [Desulfobacterales bacterium]MBU0699520.1 type II toxin-antitoxin system Phd/YefM family antitoxin [Pseudomonadota bacterium]
MAEIDKIMPVTRVKRELLEILKDMADEDSTITVTRNGEPVGVIMTPYRYDAMVETIEILADRDVMAALGRSAADFEAGRVYPDDDVWKD